MSPTELVKCVDFTNITNAITPEVAIELLEKNDSSKQEHNNLLLEKRYPTYTTFADRLGYSDDKMRKLCKEVKTEGFKHIKTKVGSDLQADAVNTCQTDSWTIGSVNEILAILLMAVKFEIPVYPYAGGLGLCKYVQHLAMIDFIAISASTQGRIIEYVTHLHDHFLDLITIKNQTYMPPQAAGYSITLKKQSLIDYKFPMGKIWNNNL